MTKSRDIGLVTDGPLCAIQDSPLNMTSSVTRRAVREGGSCLLKRIVVLGDEPFVRAAAAAAAVAATAADLWSTAASE